MQSERGCKMNKQAWYRAVYECLDGFEWLEAEIEERKPGLLVIERGLAVDEDSVRGIVRFALSGPYVAVRYSAEKWTDERVWKVLYEQPLKTSLEWDFNSREKAMEQVVVALTGIGSPRDLKP